MNSQIILSLAVVATAVLLIATDELRAGAIAMPTMLALVGAVQLRRGRPDSLALQIILSMIVLVLLTAAAAGLPATWLIRNQSERQAWAQVGQGVQAARALYAARQDEATNLAMLTAQRPTLQRLLALGDTTALPDYLQTLQEGAALDRLLICDTDHHIVGQAVAAAAGGSTTTENRWPALCSGPAFTGYYVDQVPSASQVWTVATHPIQDEADNFLGTVVVGLRLDDAFASQMRDQTGLDHTLLLTDFPVATSLGDSVPAAADRAAAVQQRTFSLAGRSYYASNWPLLTADGLTAEVALDVTDVLITQQHVARSLVIGMLAVAVVGSLLGAFLARRISRPLGDLAAATATLSSGDLDRPLQVSAKVREVALVAQALENARGDLTQTMAQLRQEKDWTDHLLHAIVEGIVTMDGNYRITFFSPGAERISGWRRAEALGLHCDQVFRVTERDQPFSQLIPVQGQRRKIAIRGPDGTSITLAITGTELAPPEGSAAQIALVLRDVSEEEIVHRMLSHFLANVSHEFRTPLSALAATAELLMDQARDLTAAELQELLTSLHLGVLNLQKLVDNLLESASIEAGRFRVYPRPSDLAEIMAEAANTMRPLLDKHGQWLVLELPAAPVRVHADPRRTVQVLVNLLSNASRYGPDDCEITLSATVGEGWSRITVADRGPGVPAVDRQGLFSRLVASPLPTENAQAGFGLGLSVVRAVVEAHGGSVGVDDRPGGGSVFWFTLPTLDERR